MKKVRNISQNELMYLDMQDITTTSFAIQYLIGYEKEIDKNLLKIAVYKLKKENPQAFVKAKNNFWIENDEEIEIEEKIIDTEDLINDDLFFEKPNNSKKTVMFYILKHKGNNYLLIKFSHSVFDGIGALNFVKALFSLINNTEFEKLDNSMTDEKFLEGLKVQNKKLNLSKKYHLKQYENKKGIIKYEVINFPKYHEGIIAKIAKVLVAYFKEQTVQFMIPTNIRRHKSDKNSISNLTLPIFIEASCEEPWEDINGKLLYELKNKNELNIKSVNHFNYRIVPKFIREKLLKIFIKQKSKNNEFLSGAIISHLGRIDINKLNILNNRAISFISLPVQQPLIPFSFVITEVNNETNIALSYYENAFPQILADNLIKDLKEAFVKKIDYRFNNTQQKYSKNFVEMIEEQINNNFQQTAIFDNIAYKFEDLDKRSSQIANILKEKDIKPQDKVVIYSNRSYDYVASVLAVLKIGACFIPIDKLEKTQRISQIITTSNAKIMLSNLIEYDDNIEVLNLNNIEGKCNQSEKFYQYDKKDEIYNIFTSGSTGIPKGVKISCENLSNYLNWAKETYKTQTRTVMPLFTSLSVDLTLTSLFLPLITGGEIKIFNDNFNSLMLEQIFRDKEINVIKCTPSHLNLLNNYSYPQKEFIIVGGENFQSNLLKKLQDISKSIVNEYGPTETTIGSIFYIAKYNNKWQHVPIGLPISNTQVFLVNKNNNLITNELETGEIIISGNGVSNGYLNSDNKNFKVFQDKNSYFTGDIGYFEDNLFHCLGRNDFQVKINGQRIELGEINSKLLNIKEIHAAETIYYKNRLISFVVKTSDISKENILNELFLTLSDNAIPGIIEFINEIPLLPNGKIDRNKLIDIINDNQNNLQTDDIINPIKLLIKEKFPDEILDFTKNTLHDIGLDSLNILIFGQYLAQKYIQENLQEKFIKSYIKEIPNSDIDNIQRLIKESGGIL